MDRIRRGWLATAALTTLPLADSPAQDADFDPFDWAYAPMFGSGVYRLRDGTEAVIVRAPLAKRLGSADGDVGVRLLFPIVAGLQNLDDDELPPGRRDDRLEMAAVLPGVELELSPTARLTLRTRAQLGGGREFEGAEESSRMGALGVRSRILWELAPGRPALINGLRWAGFDPENGARRSLLRFTNALEFEVPVPRWEFRDRPMSVLPHILGDWYYRPPDAIGFGDDGFEHLETEWQIGLAAGRDGGFELLGFGFDSVGVAYRFSEHNEGIRFYLNSVF